jgi:O-antigen/teichoic acid export membrane protein
MVLFDLIKAILLFKWRPIDVRPKFNKTALLSLINVGMPIFIATYFASIINTIPNLFILKQGGEIALGIFAPILMFYGIAEQFSGALSTYLSPKLIYKFGNGENLLNLFKLNLKVILGISSLLLVLVLPMYFLLDYFVLFFPKYEVSLPYLKLSLLTLPLVTHNLFGVFFVLLKKFFPLYILQFTKFILFSSLIYIFSNYFSKDIIYSSILGILSTYLILGIFGFVYSLKVIKNYQYHNLG